MIVAEPRNHGKCLLEAGDVVTDTHADAAAAGSGLQHDREADESSRVPRGLDVRKNFRPGQEWNARGPGALARGVLESERAHVIRSRSYERQSVLYTFRGKLGALAEKAIPWVNRFGAPLACRGNQRGAVHVAVRRRGRADTHGFVGLRDMERARIRFGIDGNGPDSHVAQGANDAAGNAAAIGDQDLRKHALLRRRF